MGCKLACSKQLYSLCSHWLSGELTVSMNRCHPRAAQPAKQAVHSMLSQPDAISGNCQNSVPYGQYINRMLGAVPMQLPLLQGCWRLGWRLRRVLRIILDCRPLLPVGLQLQVSLP